VISRGADGNFKCIYCESKYQNSKSLLKHLRRACKKRPIDVTVQGSDTSSPSSTSTPISSSPPVSQDIVRMEPRRCLTDSDPFTAFAFSDDDSPPQSPGLEIPTRESDNTDTSSISSPSSPETAPSSDFDAESIDLNSQSQPGPASQQIEIPESSSDIEEIDPASMQKQDKPHEIYEICPGLISNKILAKFNIGIHKETRLVVCLDCETVMNQNTVANHLYNPVHPKRSKVSTVLEELENILSLISDDPTVKNAPVNEFLLALPIYGPFPGIPAHPGFKCSSCAKITPDKKAMEKHIRLNHTDVDAAPIPVVYQEFFAGPFRKKYISRPTALQSCETDLKPQAQGLAKMLQKSFECDGYDFAVLFKHLMVSLVCPTPLMKLDKDHSHDSWKRCNGSNSCTGLIMWRSSSGLHIPKKTTPCL
jgi:hypothetical protein